MSETADLPDERTITTSSGETVTVRETVTEVQVSAGRKMQLEQYEPINEQVTLTAEKPSEIVGIDSDSTIARETFDEWLEQLADLAWDSAERGLMRRYEENVREDDYGE